MDNLNTIQLLGTERIPKLLLKFSIPCVMGLLISAFYNIVDQIFIGNSELGYLGNAATGISFPVICIANAFAWCIGDGAASFLSICAGRKDADRAHKCVGTGITVTSLISIVLAVIGLIWARPLMALFGASDHTLDMAVEYFRIVVAFFPFYLLMNIMNSMIRADGSPTYAMIASLVRDIICFTPLALILPVLLEKSEPGSGMNGILYAAPIADLVALVVFLFLTISFFRKTKKQSPESLAISPMVFTTICKNPFCRSKRSGRTDFLLSTAD